MADLKIGTRNEGIGMVQIRGRLGSPSPLGPLERIEELPENPGEAGQEAGDRNTKTVLSLANLTKSRA